MSIWLACCRACANMSLQNWFQNRRAKSKQDVSTAEPASMRMHGLPEDGKSSLTAEPFETHKNTVRRFLHPGSPRTLQELIAKGAIDDVTEALEKDFNEVACGEFHWLHDLVDSGCEMREIAELLVDVEASTPWLYFDTISGYQHAILSSDSHYHYHSCVHDVASRLHQGFYDIETGKLEEVFGQSEGIASKRTTQNQKVLGPYKFTHLELERQGVIQKSNVPENRRANIYFNITSPSPRTFVISLHYKGRNRGLLELDLKLDDLLEMQKEGQEDLDLEYVQFNVTKVLALLNKRFEGTSQSQQATTNTAQVCLSPFVPREIVQEPPVLNSVDGSEASRRDSIRRQIDEICGFAGVVPSRKPASQWDGQVHFTEVDGFTTAKVSYDLGDVEDEISDNLLQRLRHVGARLRCAFGLLQHHHLCCDAFTVLTESHAESTERVLDLRHISVEAVLPLLDLLDEQLSEPTDMQRLCRAAEILLCDFMPEERGTLLDDQLPEAIDIQHSDRTAETPLCNPMPEQREDRLNEQLSETVDMQQLDRTAKTSTQRAHHLTSLVLQVLSVGLLCYSHAHTGPMQPSFMATAVHRVTLLGCHPINDTARHPQITGRLVNLTCMSGFIAGPVLAFQLDKGPAVSPEPDEGGFDVIASPIDVLDTWGSALLVVCTNSMEPADVLAIEIGGGLLFNPRDTNTLHWQRLQQDGDLMRLLPELRDFSLDVRIRIGAIANSQCPLQQPDKLRDFVVACVDDLHNLGTSRPFWYHKTSQVALSGGQYGVIQFAAGFEKRDGVSVKMSMLQIIESIQSTLSLDSLEGFYGLEVSLCTGVARRIPLRVLLADVLPAFLEAYVPGPPEWSKFGPDLIDALKGPNIRDWMSTASMEHKVTAVRTLGSLLIHLKSTGIDTEGNLRVACNLPGMINQCFKLHCTEINAWAKILEDTDHCATFACTTTQCLQTPAVKCKAAGDSHWLNKAESLTTEVCRYPVVPSRHLQQLIKAHQPLVLIERATHSIGPVDAGLTASVRLTDPPTLEISRDWFRRIPERYRQRLNLLRRERLRERGSLQGHRVAVTVQAHWTTSGSGISTT
jgi:hypothetical protein